MPEGPDARERASIDALLTEHLSELRAFVGERADRLVLSKESRSDLVQSVCREVVEHAARYRHREGDAFVHWLRRTAERKIIDRYRYYTAGKRDALREAGAAAEAGWGDEPRDGGARPSQNAVAAEQAERLQRALDALPAHYRDVIRLARLEGLPLAEVAARTGRSEDAVRNLLFRALGALSDTLTGPPPR
ncbi:MAG TPA: sigma-70 family RNA polymerase sigma factor [Planctomycetota bacterium]|jgi:RNA polymerase sigma-70 factor (ECF subfamily)|nr:sigma-70 family RNA polymerase sigma factor [Planctomycetota bacterium]